MLLSRALLLLFIIVSISVFYRLDYFPLSSVDLRSAHRRSRVFQAASLSFCFFNRGNTGCVPL